MEPLFQATTQAIHLQGNDLATFPDFPAEIRAPAGTRAGVSGFQIHFSSSDIHTPGDAPGVLVAMNPAALIANVGDLVKNGLVIVNTDKFTERDLEKADLESSPLEDGTLDAFQVVPVQLGKLTKASVKGLGLGAKESDRCKNLQRQPNITYISKRKHAQMKIAELQAEIVSLKAHIVERAPPIAADPWRNPGFSDFWISRKM